MPSDEAVDRLPPTALRRALVLGGTGMLSGCVATLVAEGWNVVLPSRRYVPIPAEEEFVTPRRGEAALRAVGRPGHVPTGDGSVASEVVEEDVADEHPDVPRPASSSGKALWVQADWSQPDLLAARAGKALRGKADLLVAWVHAGYRESVLRAVAPLLAEDARVVEVHSSASAKPLVGCPEPVLPDHVTQQVVLGFVLSGNRSRWLNHREISEGVLTAVRRALDAHSSGVYQVGEFRSWARRI